MDPSTLLFAGIHFNKKRFAADFAKFEKQKSGEDSKETQIPQSNSVEDEEHRQKKKKKVKRKSCDEPGVAFNLFKAPVTEREEEEAEAQSPAFVEKRDGRVGPRRQIKVLLRKGVGSNPTLNILLLSGWPSGLRRVPAEYMGFPCESSKGPASMRPFLFFPFLFYFIVFCSGMSPFASFSHGFCLVFSVSLCLSLCCRRPSLIPQCRSRRMV